MNSDKDLKRKEKLRDYQGPDKVIGSFELHAKLEEIKGPPVLNAISKIPSLDNYCRGFQEGELITLSGPPKAGKTLMAQTLTVNFFKQQVFSLWFTFEVPVRQFLGQFKTLPVMFLPSQLKPYDFNWLEDRILESFLKYNTRVIFIDHLHYLFDMVRMKNASLEIGTFIRKLKTFAVENGFCIFLLCHITKWRKGDALNAGSLRDTGFTAAESDSVLMIQRTEDEGENTAQLRVEFHRRTGVLERTVNLVKQDGYLVEADQKAVE